MNVKGQVPEGNSLIFDEFIQIPIYELDICTAQIFKKIVDNCGADTTLNRYTYGFLFYSKNKGFYFSITIKPIEISNLYDVGFYGSFEVDGHKFYCVGDKPDILLKKMGQDSIVIRRTQKPKNDSIAIDLVMDRFADLNTVQVVQNVTLNNQLYYFFIQPCTKLSKKEVRRFKLNSNCK